MAKRIAASNKYRTEWMIRIVVPFLIMLWLRLVR